MTYRDHEQDFAFNITDQFEKKMNKQIFLYKDEEKVKSAHIRTIYLILLMYFKKTNLITNNISFLFLYSYLGLLS